MTRVHPFIGLQSQLTPLPAFDHSSLFPHVNVAGDLRLLPADLLADHS
jgi:hypothetical protein